MTPPELRDALKRLKTGKQDAKTRRFLAPIHEGTRSDWFYCVNRDGLHIVEMIDGERWSRILPLWLEYQEQLKGDVKDGTENKV